MSLTYTPKNIKSSHVFLHPSVSVCERDRDLDLNGKPNNNQGTCTEPCFVHQLLIFCLSSSLASTLSLPLSCFSRSSWLGVKHHDLDDWHHQLSVTAQHSAIFTILLNPSLNLHLFLIIWTQQDTPELLSNKNKPDSCHKDEISCPERPVCSQQDLTSSFRLLYFWTVNFDSNYQLKCSSLTN